MEPQDKPKITKSNKEQEKDVAKSIIESAHLGLSPEEEKISSEISQDINKDIQKNNLQEKELKKPENPQPNIRAQQEVRVNEALMQQKILEHQLQSRRLTALQCQQIQTQKAEAQMRGQEAKKQKQSESQSAQKKSPLQSGKMSMTNPAQSAATGLAKKTVGKIPVIGGLLVAGTAGIFALIMM